MDLVVISPEGERADEIAVVERLVAAGLQRYHVRKPGWAAEKMHQWLAVVPRELRAKMVLHSAQPSIAQWGLMGYHWRDAVAPVAQDGPEENFPANFFTSCSCHRLEDLKARIGQYDSIFYSPVFASESKAGRPALTPSDLAAVSAFLRSQERAVKSGKPTKVIALSGITPERVRDCAELGFDGVAVMGGLWSSSSNPVDRFVQYRQACCRAVTSTEKRRDAASSRNTLKSSDRGQAGASARALPAIMCLTQDGDSRSHVEQARELCAAGAKWVQLRCKGLSDSEWLKIAREVVAICRAHGAICVINDRPDLAVAAHADGAHVGQTDVHWSEARRILGPDHILGGTVNSVEDARRAVAANCLDYVGVGPWRFTPTKQKLAPVLGAEGVTQVIAALGDALPAWVIGGITAADLPAIHLTGAAGVAVSSVLYRGPGVAAQYRELALAWPSGPGPACPAPSALTEISSSVEA